MQSRPGSRLAPLRRPRFRALWGAGFFSWYGDFLTVPALLIISYRLDRELGVGLLFVFQTTPLLALLPLGGRLGDSGDRRRRSIALDLVRAALAGATVVGAQGGLLAVVLLATAGSRCASALYDPGRRRLVSVLLPPELVPAGTSLLSVVNESALLVSPAVGAVLLFFVSPSVLILIDGATFLASAILTARIGPQPSLRSRRSNADQPLWSGLRRGLDLLLVDPTTRLLAVQMGLGAAAASVIQVYFVPLAHETLHVGTNQVGIFYVVVGAATLLGSAVALRHSQARPVTLGVVGYLRLLAVAVVGSAILGPLVLCALVAFAAVGAVQEVWGLNRIQLTVPADGIGQAIGATYWCVYAGRALGAGVGAWGATNLARGQVLAGFALAAVLAAFLITLAGALVWRHHPATWPPGGPPLPL